MGSHLGETGMLGWEGDVAVDGVHGDRAKTSLGQNKEAPEQEAGRAGLMGCSALAFPKCPLLHACPFLNSTMSAPPITE